jgi:hypothetical protein
VILGSRDQHPSDITLLATSVTSTTGLPIEVSCDTWKDTSHEDALDAASL